MRKVYTKLPLIALAFLFLNSSTLFATTPVFNLNGKSICKDATVDIDITVADFTDMISFQFTVGWDISIMQIMDVPYINPAVSNDIFFGDYDSGSEVLTVSWFDNGLMGVNIPDDEVLFTVTFDGIGENSTSTQMVFLDDPTIREVSALVDTEIIVVDGVWNEDMILVAQPELATVEVIDDVNLTGVGVVDVTMTNGTAPYTYSWESGQTTEDLNNVSVGTYSCTVTDAKLCVTEIGPFTVDNTVGVKDIEGLLAVQLFPNPANSRINLNAKLENTQLVDVNIYNVFGEKIYTEQIENANIELDLDISDFTTGNYIVQLSTKDGMYTQKLQVNRY